jgi:anti-sigma factor RsiW
MNTCQLPEDRLEKYAMRLLSDQESAPLEEHLLVCQECQHRLEELDEFVRVAKTALASLEARPAPQQLPVRNPRKISRSPKTLWAIGLAAVLLIGFEPVVRSSGAAVALTTERGASALTRTQAGWGIVLKMDVTQIAQPDGYQLEVVDAVGQPVWHAAAEASDNQLTATVGKYLAPGRYWVRLYDTGTPWTLLREYGLDVEN